MESIGQASGLEKDLLLAFDQWLGNLPLGRRRALIPSEFARDATVDLHLAYAVFSAGRRHGFLRAIFNVFCPECGEFVQALNDASLLEESITCDNEHEFVPADHDGYVRVHYEVLDRPQKKTLIASRS